MMCVAGTHALLLCYVALCYYNCSYFLIIYLFIFNSLFPIALQLVGSGLQ